MSECAGACHNTETHQQQVDTKGTEVPAQTVQAKDPQAEADKVRELILNKKLQFTMRLLNEDEKTYQVFDKKQQRVVELPHRCRVCLDLATHIEVAGKDGMCVLYYCPEHAVKNTSQMQRIQTALRAQKEQEKHSDLPLHEVQSASDQGNATESQPGLPDSPAE